MHLFRNKGNKLLYTIEYLVKDIWHLNCNGFSGIYAHPYKHTGSLIRYFKDKQKSEGLEFKPLQFVEDNFEVVCEL